MNLADLQRAQELSAELVRIDGRRSQILYELRALGIETEDAPQVLAPQMQAHRPLLQMQAVAEPRMTVAEARSEARRRILGPIENELRQNGGYLDDPSLIAHDLEIMAERRASDIEQLARELLNPPPARTCAECGQPATTIIAGADYCTLHSQTVRRLEPPAGLELPRPYIGNGP